MVSITHIGLLARHDHLLVTADGSPPSFTIDSSPWFWQDVGATVDRFTEIIGARVSVLRPLATQQLEQGSVRIYELEAHERVEGSWTELDAIVDPLPGRSVRRLLAPLPDGPLAVPWYRSGWHSQANRWIHDSLAPTDYEVVGVRQRRSWGLSTLFDIDTTTGPLFFKANGPPFADEIAKTATLAELYPAVLPGLVVADVELGWAILEDAGSVMLETVDDFAVWDRAVRSYARMQIDSCQRSSHLERAGIPVYDSELIARQVRQMVDDEEMLRAGEHRLSTAEITAVRAHSGTWIRAIEQIEALGIPHAVEHGDLHAGQFIIDGSGDARIVDWSDVSLANPLISLDTFLGAITRNYRDRVDQTFVKRAVSVCREAYLDEWSSVVDPDRLNDGLRFIAAATHALQALPYWRLMPKMEQPWEFENVTPWLLRQALAAG